MPDSAPLDFIARATGRGVDLSTPAARRHFLRAGGSLEIAERAVNMPAGSMRSVERPPPPPLPPSRPFVGFGPVVPGEIFGPPPITVPVAKPAIPLLQPGLGVLTLNELNNRFVAAGSPVANVIEDLSLVAGRILFGQDETLSARAGRTNPSGVFAGALNAVDPGHTFRAVAASRLNRVCVPPEISSAIAKDFRRQHCGCR